MDYAFVLEDDPTQLKQITDALKAISGALEVKSFANLAEFSTMVKSIMTHGALALQKDEGAVRVVLVIARLESIGMGRLSLLEKTRDFFMRRGVCTPEEPTRFVLTAFDDPNLKFDKLKQPILANILFKPFDRLILEAHLMLAIPQVKSSLETLANQKTKAPVEMLKTVNLESMTELGFTSRSQQALEVGSISKYYGKEFVSERHRSLMARLISCRPIPPDNKEFELEFRFFALDSVQIANLRKRIRHKDGLPIRQIHPEFTGTPMEKVTDEQSRSLNFVVINPNEEEALNLIGTLKRKIRGAVPIHFATKRDLEEDLKFAESAHTGILSVPASEIEANREMVVTTSTIEGATIWGEPLQGAAMTRYFLKEDGQALGLWLMGNKAELRLRTNFAGKHGVLKFVRANGKVTISELSGDERSRFLRNFRKIKGRIGAVFIDRSDIDVASLGAWTTVRAEVEKDQGFVPPCYLMSKTEFTDDEEKLLSESFNDLFFTPLDRIYLLQRMIFDIPYLNILEDPIMVSRKEMPHVIRAATPITIDEVSEAVLVFNYYRPIEIGSFREFILWQPNELAAPEIAGVVQGQEAGDDKTPSRIFITFFGVRDHQLKAVRLWILNNYISSKEKG